MRDGYGIYVKIAEALSGPLARIPVLTIFGERNDAFGFQKRWKELFPDARPMVVENGNHFTMCGAPDLVARTIREWHQKHVAGLDQRDCALPSRSWSWSLRAAVLFQACSHQRRPIGCDWGSPAWRRTANC